MSLVYDFVKPLKIWDYLLRQLFFQSFQGGAKGKMLKNCQNYTLFFSVFFLWSPIGNHEKKSCLNRLKFWEASRNHKRSLSWKFQYSILKNAKTSHIPASISENPVPLCKTKYVLGHLDNSLESEFWSVLDQLCPISPISPEKSRSLLD